MSLSVQRMKWIDRYVGVPACATLSLWRRLTRATRATGTGTATPPDHTLRKILYVELSEMGSMVAAAPILQTFQQQHPDAEMYFLTFAQNRACLDVLHLVPRDHVITIETTSLSRFAVTLFETLRRLRGLRLDAVVDFELFSRISALLSGLAGARLSAGFTRLSLEGLYRGQLHTHPVGYNPYTHISCNFQALISALEGAESERGLLKVPLQPPALPLHRPPMDAARRAVLWHHLKAAAPTLGQASPLVILNPNAGNLLPIRAWPLASYIDLTRRLLLAMPDLHVAIMGTDEAATDAARMVRDVDSPRLIDFTRKTTFADVIPLLSLADLLITNDSGPAHFASLTDTAILVFFGPETPVLYRPLSPRSHCFYAGYHCSPCLSAYNHRTTTCTNNRCLQGIRVEEVEARAREFLDASPRPERP